MKKTLICLLLCTCMLFVFAACDEGKDPQDQNPSENSGSVNTDTPTPPDENQGGDNTDVPSSPDDTPPSPPAITPPEVVRSESYGNRVKEDEMILHNGITLGLDFDTAAAYAGYLGEKGDSFTCDGITYIFKDSLLACARISKEAQAASVFRDIKIGDSSETVFSKLPGKNKELREWAQQDIYGSDKLDKSGFASLFYVTKRACYLLKVYAGDSITEIAIPRTGTNVSEINVYTVEYENETSVPTSPPDGNEPAEPQEPSKPQPPRVKSEEIALPSGVKPGMKYSEIYEIIGYEGDPPMEGVMFIEHQNILYSFKAEEDEFILVSMTYGEGAGTAVFREVKVGDSVESVFEQIPGSNKTLREWAQQDIYGRNESDTSGFATLKFNVKSSSYSLLIYTADYVLELKIPRSTKTVSEIIVLDR